MAKKKPYVDIDTTDEFLDRPLPTYGKDGHTISYERLNRELDPEYRRAHGLGPIPKPGKVPGR